MARRKTNFRPWAAPRGDRILAGGLVLSRLPVEYCVAMLLESVLPQLIRIGRLTLIDAAGRRHVFEGDPGPTASVRLHDPALHWKLLANPRVGIAEAYMEGRLTIEEGSL